MNMRKKLSVFIIILGIMIALYPFMEQGFTWYWQKRLLKDWNNRDAVEAYRVMDDLMLTEFTYEDEVEEKERAPLTPQGEMLGILIIESIDLRLPIISGLNETNLKIGISFLEETAKFGEFGNTVIAGHRGHSYGRLLNRLNEVTLDDEVIISTDKGDFKYKVTNVLIVEPEDIQVLFTDKKEKMLSIVTCEPVFNPTLRLIVQARLEE